MDKLELNLMAQSSFVCVVTNLYCITLFGPRREKTCHRGSANIKAADQPAHPRSLISAFVIHLLESIISQLAAREISIFLASLCS